jgi:2-dehydro-3-deoxyphosphogluconate aldolase/(4S)-4-hydroxy-2-oxoglutarate aldolase
LPLEVERGLGLRHVWAMNQAENETLFAELHRVGVIAVLVLDRVADAVPVAQALLAGGVGAIELTLRTPIALEALAAIRAEVPEMLVGVGTILTPAQLGAVQQAGAAFGVAPGMNPRVVAEAVRVGLPFAPGVCTPTDIELALEQGCRVMKLFPAEPCGGLAYLRTIAAPFAHLGVKFIPLGGLDRSNARSYLEEPSVLALGGSWIASRERIQRQEWAAITGQAQLAAELVKEVRGGQGA